MEKKMMMPANYNVMTEEEMTYTQGGAAADGAAILAGVVSTVSWVASIAVGGLYLYNYYQGMVAARGYVSAHKGENASQLIEGGLNTYVNYMQKDIASAVKGIAAGIAAVNLFPITALCLITA